MLPNGVFNEAVLEPMLAGTTFSQHQHYVSWLDLYLCNDDNPYQSRSNTWYLSMGDEMLLCKIVMM